jgi:nickel-dependent lactate racemase
MADVIGYGHSQEFMSDEQVRDVLAQSFAHWDLSGKRVLVIIPDGTRTAPMPLMFRLLHELLEDRVQALDFLVALGTHLPMDEEALCRHLGISAEERHGRYAKTQILNHEWDKPETFADLGVITTAETEELSNGMLSLEVPVRVNRLLLEYDQLVICGPVFPHEVVGFSGGSKYFFPGVSGPEVINFTHWLGALITSYEIIGTKHTPVRAVIEKAAALIPTPKLALCLVNRKEGLSGLYVGQPIDAWEQAADLSAQIHVTYVDKPFKTVVSVMPKLYDDLWTGAKGMYKVEPVVADGGEVIIYAPHITEVSYTHGAVLDRIGYHVRDYFIKQWDKFKDEPWGVLAHSTHARGAGSFVDGVETPRIRVTLATGIPEERCRMLGLGYIDPATFNPEEYANREDESILYIPYAGELLYRLR